MELLQKCGGNSKSVTAGELDNLFLVPERGTHDNGLVAIFLIVIVDACNANHTWILRGSKSIHSQRLLLPIHDSSHEGRNEGGSSLGTCNGLGLAENESAVASDALLLEDLARLNTLPSRGNLDQDTRLVDPHLFVKSDDLSGLGNGGLGVERQAGIDLGGHIPRHDLGNFGAEIDCQLVLFHVDG